MTAQAASRAQRWRERSVSLEAVAVTGVLFAVLFVASVSLMRAGLPEVGLARDELQRQYQDRDARRLVLIGYSLAPFAAACFLWFIGVMRRRIPGEDRFVATVFVAGGTTFVALFLVAASLVGGPYYLLAEEAGTALDASTLMGLQSAAYGLVFVIGVRVQVLVILTATSAGRQHGALPRWLVIAGYVVALVQTLNLALFEPLIFTFPAWVVAVSLTLLVRGRSG